MRSRGPVAVFALFLVPLLHVATLSFRLTRLLLLGAHVCMYHSTPAHDTSTPQSHRHTHTQRDSYTETYRPKDIHTYTRTSTDTQRVSKWPVTKLFAEEKKRKKAGNKVKRKTSAQVPTSSANTHAISTNGEMKRRLQHVGRKGKGGTQQTKRKVGEVNYVQGQKKKGGVETQHSTTQVRVRYRADRHERAPQQEQQIT